VIHVGGNAPNNIAFDPNVQELDLVKIKDTEQPFQVGDAWNLTHVESVHEVKTSMQNKFEGRQRQRYLALTNNGEKLFIHFTQYTYDGTKMVINKQYAAREKVLIAIGLGFTAAVGTVWAAKLDEFRQFLIISDDTIGWAAKVASQTARGTLSQADHDTYAHKVSEWTVAMNAFVQDLLPPDAPFDGSQIVAKTILSDMLSSYGSGQ
jgi:hypothetical protein